MATFSSNQVRHFYVANDYSATQVTAESAVGTLSVGGNAESGVYLGYSGPGGLVRSDLINPAKLSYVKATKAADMATKLRKDIVTLDANINAGEPIVGQDYLLRITFKQKYSLGVSDQDVKYGAVRVTPGMTAAQFYTTMADSLTRNFSREVTQSLKFSATADGIVIEEVAQPWTLGKMEGKPLHYYIQPDLVVVEGMELIWGKVTPQASTTVIKNGKKVADLEYFAMGERADLYRGVGFPNDIETTYLVDATKEYSLIDLGFYYSGEGAYVQESQKLLTIAVPDGAGEDVYTNINAILGDLGDALGVTIAELA